MAGKEIDSFYLKSQRLLYSEKNAILSMNSEAGKVNVTLTVTLDNVLSDIPPPLPRYLPPSYQRSRGRRAEERRLASEEAAKTATATREDSPREAEAAAEVDKTATTTIDEPPKEAEEVSTYDKETIYVTAEAEKAQIVFRIPEIDGNIPQPDGTLCPEAKRISFYKDGVP